MPVLETFGGQRGRAGWATYSLGDPAGALELAQRAPAVAVDIETAGLGPYRWQIKAYSVGTVDRAVVLDPVEHADAIRAVHRTARRLIFHNATFDVPALVNAGLLELGHIAKAYDTLVTARLTDPGYETAKDLGAACKRHLSDDYGAVKRGLEESFKGLGVVRSKAEAFRRLGLTDPAYVVYAAFDVVMTARLAVALPAALELRLTAHPFPAKGDALELDHREQTVNRLMLRRSALGIALDYDIVEELMAELRHSIALADDVLEAHGIDPGLGQVKAREAVVDALELEGKLPAVWPRLKNGRPTTSKRWLERLEGHELALAIRARGEAEHFLTDYATKVADVAVAGRIHPMVNVAAAATGRMSVGSPPLQQYPASVRKMMRGDWPLTSFDWSSIEPVLIANLAGELELVETYEAGGDLYAPVALAAGVDRKTAKTTLLAQLYGQGATSLGLRLGVDRSRAQRIVDDVMAPMPKVAQTIKAVRRIGDALGLVQTISGRIIPLPGDPETANRRFLGYKGVNYLVQGSAYDLLAEALLELDRRGLGAELFMAVHDELVVATAVADEVDDVMRRPPEALCRASGRVPVLRTGRADLGLRWNAKEAVA